MLTIYDIVSTEAVWCQVLLKVASGMFPRRRTAKVQQPGVARINGSSGRRAPLEYRARSCARAARTHPHVPARMLARTRQVSCSDS
ncbi:hypothetical protein B5X24_HaOG209278 [Helicoverpa armigera]|nr:hypothetical protein B5X24_HaOG209278 [Helicoverpa armigera]